MYFNTFPLKSSVDAAFSIVPAVSGTMKWGTRWSDDHKDALTFWPSSNLRVNTKYTVTIDTRAKDLHGTRMKEPYTFTFVTLPEL